jgi:N-acetylmuramoyl-L-alanine amidase
MRRAYTATVPDDSDAACAIALSTDPASAILGSAQVIAAAVAAFEKHPRAKARRFTMSKRTDEELPIPRTEAFPMIRLPRRRAFVAFVTFGVAVTFAVSCRAVDALGVPLAGDTFVIDPGHGTRYPDGSALNVGAVGPDGVQEQVVVLDVAEDLARLLRAAGARVVLTRSHAHPFRIAEDKRLDNRARAALANRLRATAFVAIHADSSLGAAQRGTSVFWLRPNSVALAAAMRRELATLGFGESEFRARDLAVTNEARVPAVLVELGFVSNPGEERLLATAAFQEREARALFDALAATFAR